MKHEPSNKLFLKGVPLHVKEQDLRSWLTIEDSMQAPSLKEIIDSRTNSRRGWWIATFESPTTATAVMTALSGRTLAGKSVKLNYTA